MSAVVQDGGGSLTAKHKPHPKRRTRKAGAWARRLQDLATKARGGRWPCWWWQWGAIDAGSASPAGPACRW